LLNLFHPSKTISAFSGNFRGYGAPVSRCTLKILSDDKTNTITLNTYYDDNKNIWYYKTSSVVDGKNAWITRDGRLIREMLILQDDRYNESWKDVEILLIYGDKLTGTLYKDYIFKGPFGGYWFANKYQFVYLRQKDKDNL